MTGLMDVRHNTVQSYSGGMKRRLSVAISALGNPSVLFMVWHADVRRETANPPNPPPPPPATDGGAGDDQWGTVASPRRTCKPEAKGHKRGNTSCAALPAPV